MAQFSFKRHHDANILNDKHVVCTVKCWRHGCNHVVFNVKLGHAALILNRLLRLCLCLCSEFAKSLFYLAECHGIYEIDYITSIFGGSCISKKKENAQRILSNCNLYVTRLMRLSCRWQPTNDEKMVSMFYFLNIINLVSFQAWSRLMTSFQ